MSAELFAKDNQKPTFAPVTVDWGTEKPVYRYAAAEAQKESPSVFQIKLTSEVPAKQIARKMHEKLGVAKEGELYVEILSHDPEHVNLTRTNPPNKAALLDEHFDNRHLGSIRQHVLSTDKCTRAVIEFDGITKLSQTRSKQVAAGSRPNFSAGYRHTKYLGPVLITEGELTGRTGHKFAFESCEASSVAVPADPDAQTNRSKAGTTCACIRCGERCETGDMVQRDGANMCQDCADAETPAENEETERAGAGRMYRAKAKDGTEKQVSHNQVESAVISALYSDKRFKRERENGDKYSDYRVDDIQHVASGGDYKWLAYVESPAYSNHYHEVDFTFDGTNAELGESNEVVPKMSFEPVERGVNPITRWTRTAAAKVDSAVLPTAATQLQIITRTNFMADNPTKITPELIVDNLDNEHVKRALTERGYRSKMEIEAAQKTQTDRLGARNKELQALEAECVRDFGSRIARKKNAEGKTIPTYLRDAIHIASLECQAMGDDKPDTEIRQMFRSRVDDFKRDSVSEENIFAEVHAAEDGPGSRCGDIFDVMKRTLADAQKRGVQSTGLKPDGAEGEYDAHIRKQLHDVPGGARLADAGGFISPRNCRSKIPTGRKVMRSRVTRDALAEDFATAGALISPEFHPYIELLRNKIVVSALGATYLGGLMGDQVFPRQEAATIAQSMAEGAQLQPYDQTLGQIRMTPHRIGSRQYYSRLALIQAPPDFEALIWNDHAAVLALYQDEMAFNGAGAGDQPLGLLNQPGIGQILLGGTMTYAQLVSFRTSIRKANVPGRLAFTTTSSGQGRMAVLPETLVGSTVVSGSTNAMWKGNEEDGEVLGCTAVASQQIPGDVLLAGVFSNLIIGSWGGINTILDNYTRADRDEVAVTFNTYFDVALRHAQAFIRSLDAVTQ